MPLDRIIHAEVWATDTISADLPPMVEFKKQADKIIKKRYGIEVEHISAIKNGEKLTYEKQFYSFNSKKKRIYGFPFQIGAWCNSYIKEYTLNYAIKKTKNAIKYIGIAADEKNRIVRWTRDGFSLPLVKINWSEADCLKWCKENDLLSPIYTTTTTRGGCWFCHNQTVGQLRVLRKNYPELWAILMKWDTDSPTTFTTKHTIHDFERRFSLEEKGIISTQHFRWNMLSDELLTKQMTLEDVFTERRGQNESK